MTTRLTPARQAPSVLGRLSTMRCSRLVPGDRQQGRGGAATPKMPLVVPSGAASLVSPSKCCEETAGASWVLLGGLGIPWAPGQGMLLSSPQAGAKPELCWRCPGCAAG